MRNVILDLTMSLDGYIEGVNGEIDWIIFDQQMASVLNLFADEIDTIIYGRKSYDLWGEYKPEKPVGPDEAKFYDKIHGKKKIVMSRTMGPELLPPNVSIISENIPEHISRLKSEPGKSIWLYGGAELIKTFMKEDLIDIYRLTINPVILGDGKPLFSKIPMRQSLLLQDVEKLDNGLVNLVYTRSR